MSKLTGLCVGGSVAGLLGVIWLVNGQSVDSLIAYAVEEWSTILLAGQIVALFVTAVLKHYVASFVLLCTTVLTVLGAIA